MACEYGFPQARKLMAKKQLNLTSIYQACSWFQTTPWRLRRIAKRLQIKAQLINDVDHFKERDVDRLESELVRQRAC